MIYLLHFYFAVLFFIYQYFIFCLSFKICFHLHNNIILMHNILLIIHFYLLYSRGLTTVKNIFYYFINFTTDLVNQHSTSKILHHFLQFIFLNLCVKIFIFAKKELINILHLYTYETSIIVSKKFNIFFYKFIYLLRTKIIY
jgi:hypothetical protein